MKVLIVDDEPAHVRGIIKYVDWDGLGVQTQIACYSAKEALRILEKGEIDLVITDINMPEVSGLELIRRIRLIGKKPDIIILSGYNEFSYAQEAIDLGVAAYILKPIKPEEIENRVRLLLEKKQRIEKNEVLSVEMDILQQINGCEGEVEINLKHIHPSIQQTILYVAGHYFEDISLQWMAEQLGMNESYLSALFKKEVGVNLTKYLKQYRMYKALELIRHSDLRINEIATKIGFRNPCYFTEQFKTVYQLTPSEIRKEQL